MTSEEFVRTLKATACQKAGKRIVDLLADLPGRRPAPENVELSRWIRNLQASDREAVARVAEMAADQAIYTFLLMLDGLKAFEPSGPKGALELFYSNGKDRVRLNNPDDEELTVLFKTADAD